MEQDDKSTRAGSHFIRKIINDDLEQNKHTGQLVTRFPPEPNGYLHIGHAKAICLNFSLAKEFAGICYLRFDDTNPEKESDEFIQAIKADVHWLGYDWGDHQAFASDYFARLYECAVYLIKAGKAYVDSLSAEDIRAYRGTLTEPGKNSPYRDRTVEENLDLFTRMKQGEFAEGKHILRAKIDMASGNMNLRDPAIYRVKKVKHHRTGDEWCIYPMYDFTHPLSDSFEDITYSLCTLEFQDHRPLYDWFIQSTGVEHQPRQIEFSRLNLNYTITSKRKLKQLVEGGHVAGWDDPRMPTLCGLRRRGVPAESIRNFCQRIGISKQDSVIDMSVLEEEIRDYLNVQAPRRMAVLEPLKVVITNFEEDQVEWLEVSNHPQNPDFGTRKLPLTREIYIEQDDFRLDPPSKFFRLSPGGEVRLRNAYVIKCTDVIQDDDGNVIELHCQYDKDTLGGKKPKDGHKVKGIVHWVSAEHAIDADVRLYDRLFTVANPAAEDDFIQYLNSESLTTLKQAKVEASLGDASPEDSFQFTRLGYFCADRQDYQPERPVFNRITTLRSTWDKAAK